MLKALLFGIMFQMSCKRKDEIGWYLVVYISKVNEQGDLGETSSFPIVVPYPSPPVLPAQVACVAAMKPVARPSILSSL